jgi:hypothetical protein
VLLLTLLLLKLPLRLFVGGVLISLAIHFRCCWKMFSAEKVVGLLYWLSVVGGS